MCGITGLITSYNNTQDLLLSAEDLQRHRGPNFQGLHHQRIGKWQINLGHQRLSILDLSDLGNQPMCSPSGHSWIVYNGEIYNYIEIRSELKSLGYTFQSDSDTEVLIIALEHWGIEKTLSKCNGMWSFAWLNIANNQLFLARDRMGVKPLYYFRTSNSIYLASEIKAILAMTNGHKFHLNYQIAGEYLIQSLTETSNQTFFEGIEKLPAGTYASIDLSSDNLNLSINHYWKLSINSSYEDVSATDLVDQVRGLFFDAVKLRLRSDVPVGVLLSGGLDSSSIASFMQVILGKNENLNLLSSVSQDPRYDESYFIDIMGRYLNLPVHKVVLNLKPQKAFDYLSQVCWYNDEPVGSFSNVAHYLLMQQAHEMGVTVILSGQGADELLCGYKKYLGFHIQSLIQNGKYFRSGRVLWDFLQNGTIVSQFSFNEAKRYLPDYFNRNEIDIRGENLLSFSSQFTGLGSGVSVKERQKLDLEKFSVPTLVHTEDRMSMAWGREIRVPFMDYRLVELLVSLPIELKLTQGWTKFIFRKAMEPYLPKEITWRKDKQGFVNPQSEWLKDELRPGVLDYFSPDSLIFATGLVNRNNLLKKYTAFCSRDPYGNRISFKDIFNPLALEIWLRKFESYIV